MKTGLTIKEMAQELLRQSKAKQDYLVNTGSLSLSVTSDVPQLRVTENGLDKITPLDIRQTAHRQLGTYLGIPQKYYELMRTDAPELLAYNANYWFSQKNELRTLRTMDGCARAFLSNRYRRIDNLDIASVTLPVIGELPEARFVSTQITDDFMYIKVVNPRLQADVVPGDVVQAGVIISNSETGLGSVTIQPLIYRLVCSNGMVINDAKTRRNHVGRAATSEEDFSIYSNETLLADDHAFVLKIKDTVRAAISEARFAQVVSQMRESTEAMLDTKQLPAVVKLASSSFGITEDESNGVLEHLITGGDFSLYGLANAVTRFSQDVESYYNRIFENYTGEVATWYSASPSIFESDCRISPQTIFEVVYQGRLCARDGNGDFEGKIPFVPFFEFERREAIRCSKKLPNLKGYEQMKEKLLSLPGGEQYSLHGACQDNWIYALSFGKETVQVIDTSEWMGRPYELIAVLYTHKPTGFQFTNYCIRPAGIISSSSRHDLLLYDWAEHQAGADSY